MLRVTSPVTLAVLALTFLPGTVPSEGKEDPRVKCSVFETKYAGCNGNKDQDGNDSSNNGNGDNGNWDDGPDRRSREECAESWEYMLFCFEKRNDDKEDEDEEDPGTPDFSISDVARFAPDPSPLKGEPDNVGVEGLAVNFVSPAKQQVEEGELLGYPISVRFTPVKYTFHYGDGSTKVADTGGATWADLGQAQFSATDTSHAYAERGTYTARVDVSYTAEVGLDDRWFPLTGQLTIEGSDQSIRIYEADTALVARTCEEQPTAPGC